MTDKDDKIVDLKKRIKTADWRDSLMRSGEGFTGDERNVLIAFRSAPELAGLVQYNEFALHVELARSPPWRKAKAGARWLETDDVQASAWLQGAGLKLRGTSAVASCVIIAAMDSSYHPVRHYLDHLVWDGTERLGSMLAQYFGATGDTDYLRAAGAKFMISAVARIQKPGCQADHMLVLEGAQGIGKTSVVRALAGCSEWFAGNLPDIHSKDAAMQLTGKWIIEIAELKAMRNSQLEAVKTFLTETVDTFRPPYARRSAQFPRQSVFIATTNEREYLRDRTGNRRYWPVRCAAVDVPGITRDRDQLWAEAEHEFRSGTAWHLTAHEQDLASEEQQARLFTTETETDVAVYLHKIAEYGQQEVSVRDVLTFGLGLNPDDKSYAESARKLGAIVAEAMELAGWTKDKQRGRGPNRRTVYRCTKSH